MRPRANELDGRGVAFEASWVKSVVTVFELDDVADGIANGIVVAGRKILEGLKGVKPVSDSQVSHQV